jgi:hypothetical protein
MATRYRIYERDLCHRIIFTPFTSHKLRTPSSVQEWDNVRHCCFLFLYHLITFLAIQPLPAHLPTHPHMAYLSTYTIYPPFQLPTHIPTYSRSIYLHIYNLPTKIPTHVHTDIRLTGLPTHLHTYLLIHDPPTSYIVYTQLTYTITYPPTYILPTHDLPAYISTYPHMTYIFTHPYTYLPITRQFPRSSDLEVTISQLANKIPLFQGPQNAH